MASPEAPPFDDALGADDLRAGCLAGDARAIVRVLRAAASPPSPSRLGCARGLAALAQVASSAPRGNAAHLAALWPHNLRFAATAAVASAMGAHPDCPAVARRGLAALTALAEPAQCWEDIATDGGGMRALVGCMVNHRHEASVVWAAARLASGDVAGTTLAMSPTLRMSWASGLVRARGATPLLHAMSDAVATPAARGSGLWGEVARYASLALAAMCGDRPPVTRGVIAAGGVGAVLAVLRSPHARKSPAVAGGAVSLLMTLILHGDGTANKALLEGRAVDAVIDTMAAHPGDRPLRDAGCTTLHAFVCDYGLAAAAEGSRAMDVLLPALAAQAGGDMTPVLGPTSLPALRVLCCGGMGAAGRPGTQQVVQRGGVPHIVALLKAWGSTDVQAAVAGATLLADAAALYTEEADAVLRATSALAVVQRVVAAHPGNPDLPLYGSSMKRMMREAAAWRALPPEERARRREERGSGRVDAAGALANACAQM